jgi:GH35 family endo-1,4-beta-xylanase
MQEKKYKDLFAIMRKYSKNISSVTFWNVSDRDSWLGADNYPLPFDRNYQPKPLYRVIRDFK